MSKRRRTNPNNKFVMIERWFWRCPAWQALPHPARSLYIELEMLYDGQNNGQLEMGIRKAMRLLQCSFNFTRKMFTELEAKGFVRHSQRGSFSWKSRHETTWILTRYELKDKPATSEYMRWQPAEKQNTDSPQASDRRSTSVRDTSDNPFTDAPRASVKADSGPPTDAPQESSYSIPPIPLSERRSERDYCESAPPSAGPYTQNGFAKPSGNQRAKAKWLKAQLEGGVLSVDDVIETLGIGFADVFSIASGKTSIASTAWRKLAALAAGRMN